MKSSAPIRIIMIAPTPYFSDRGCHVRIYEEARTLIEMGHDVHIVTYHLGRDMAGIPTTRIVKIPWYKKLSAGPSWHKLYLDTLLFFKAFTLCRSFKPDVIHAHLHEGAFIGICLRRIFKIPLLFDCQGSLTDESIDHGFFNKDSFMEKLFRRVENFINKRADAIITSSTKGAEDMVSQWGLSPSLVTPLTDGVNCEEFKIMDKGPAREVLNLPSGKQIVAFVGLFNRYQGVDLLLEVVKIMQERQCPVHFLLMGFPEDKYKKMSEETGIADMITFTGRVDYHKVPSYLSAADIAVSPKISLTEANGKLFNYMASGIPSVVFDTPVNREILGDAGKYAAFGDKVAFANAIEELVSDRELRVKLSEMGRERAVSEHSWGSRGKKLESIYRRLIDR